MDTFVNENDFLLLSRDRYTFEVLTRILKGKCDLVLTNHENIIFCHSESQYPIWIWTPDDAADEVKEAAWELVCLHRPFTKGFRFNLKYELAEYFIAKAAESGMTVGISTNMYAYDCPSPIRPDIAADGELYCCTADDAEEAAATMPYFYTEIGSEAPPPEFCIEKAKSYIAENSFFFWKNSSGKTVACCSYNVSDNVASIHGVFTFPDERRRHYAQSMVYQVTQKVSEMGYMPMLYTDADYRASNSCYEKIGYILRGKLCTVSAK